MELYELDLKQVLEIKLFRLNKPRFNSLNNSLTGLYNSNEDLNMINSLSSKNQLQNKLNEFNLNDEYTPSPENFFVIEPTFGKVLYGETFEGILILNNTCDYAVSILDIKIRVFNEIIEQYEMIYKKVDTVIYHYPNSKLIIEPNKFYSHKVKFPTDIVCKYR